MNPHPDISLKVRIQSGQNRLYDRIVPNGLYAVRPIFKRAAYVEKRCGQVLQVWLCLPVRDIRQTGFCREIGAEGDLSLVYFLQCRQNVFLIYNNSVGQ